MAVPLNPPLTPNGHVLKVIHVARISTLNEEELSLTDQGALLRRYVTDHYDGLVILGGIVPIVYLAVRMFAQRRRYRELPPGAAAEEFTQVA